MSETSKCTTTTSPDHSPRSQSRHRLALIATVTVLAIAVGVRAAGIFGELWLDEIWSLNFARDARSPFDVILKIKHDNNHPLNTLFLYVIGFGQPDYTYRLLSLLMGVGTVVMAGVIGLRYGPWEGVLSMVFVGLSFPLVQYSSEARGYSLAAFFSLLAFSVAQRQVEEFRWNRCVLFGFAAILGVLSHLTFLSVFAGLMAWLTVAMRFRNRAILELLAMFLAPLACYGIIFWVNVREMVIGGGPEQPLGNILEQTISSVFGVPNNSTLVILAVAFVLLASLFELLATRRSRPHEWLFFLVGCIVCPALVLAMSGRNDIYPRYFLLSGLFVLLLFARAAARGFRAGSLGRVLFGAAVLGFVVGNSLQILELLRHGRSNYRPVLEYCVLHTPAEVPITISSDHNFRNRVVIDYHTAVHPMTRPIQYVNDAPWATAVSYWTVRSGSLENGEAPQEIVDLKGVRYDLAATFLHSGLGERDLFLYRIHEPMKP